MDDVFNRKLYNQIECKHGATRCVIFNKDGNYCITGGSDNRITLWNPYTGKNLKTYCGHAAEVTDIAATSDNACIASSSEDKLVLLWDVSTGTSVNRWRRHLGRVNTVCINDESNVIISGGVDKHVYAWDRRSRSINPIQGFTEARDSVVSIDSHKWFIVTASVDNYIRTYDLRMGQLKEDFVGHIPLCVKIASDCHFTLVNCSDNSVRLFDLEDGALLKQFSGHKNNDYRIGCAFLPGNSHLLCGSADGLVYTWSLLTGACCQKTSVPLINAGPIGRGSNIVVHTICPHPTNRNRLLAIAGDHLFLFDTDEEAVAPT